MLREGDYGAFYRRACQRAGADSLSSLRPLEFTHVMIDEAGQASLAPAVYALLCMLWYASAMLCSRQQPTKPWLDMHANTVNPSCRPAGMRTVHQPEDNLVSALLVKRRFSKPARKGHQCEADYLSCLDSASGFHQIHYEDESSQSLHSGLLLVSTT